MPIQAGSSPKVPTPLSRPISTASIMNLSAPPQPAIRPTKPIRRRPGNLTIRRTPALDKAFSKIADMVPLTPHIGLSLPTTVQNPTFQKTFQNTEEGDQHLDSRESTKKSERGYPDGPIRIYDSGVYLYLEPTAEEAAKFDVVLNMAKEVPNPFSKSDRRDNTVMSTLRNTSPQSANSSFEFLPSEPATPMTPKPQKPRPEYIHVNWDHNSEILDDLYPLCELIDDRVSKGKTVLIHCQLGVSRSASMVIAYGLYKNPHLDFNAMYGIVKSKSDWIGPNMSLIYQLTDFRSQVL